MIGFVSNKKLLLGLVFVTHAITLHASTITITTPADSSTVSGRPLSVTGTSSDASTTVRVTVNTTITGYTTTDISGNWALTSSDIDDGNYTVTADLLDVNSVVLATDTNSFTISNSNTIKIADPLDGGTVYTNQFSVSGTSSLASTTVNVSVDGTLSGTTTTDAAGNWITTASLATGGSHTILAELIVGSPVASDTITVTAAVSLMFPTGKQQVRIVSGVVPTSGSGSGTGFSYSTSGTITTITFTPAFSATPSLIATGGRASGMSTTVVSSISSSAANITWSTGTTSIQFYATLLS